MKLVMNIIKELYVTQLLINNKLAVVSKQFDVASRIR